MKRNRTTITTYQKTVTVTYSEHPGPLPTPLEKEASPPPAGLSPGQWKWKMDWCKSRSLAPAQKTAWDAADIAWHAYMLDCKEVDAEDAEDAKVAAPPSPMAIAMDELESKILFLKEEHSRIKKRIPNAEMAAEVEKVNAQLLDCIAALTVIY